MFRWAVLLALAVLFMAAVGAREPEELWDLVPDPFEGFTADDEGPYHYPHPDSLLDIYNGGYMVYVDGGVMAATSQAYYSDDTYYTVVLHDVNSPFNASRLVSYFRDQISGLDISDIDLGDGGFEYSYQQTNFIYYSAGDLFITLQGGEGTLDALRSSARETYERSVPELWAASLAMLVVIGPRKFVK